MESILKRRIARNALLAKPPQQFHYLTRATTYGGRRITAADYEGVHTTTKFDQAASYAASAVEKCRCGYPVVLELDVSGLSAMPDIDAVLTAESGMLDNDSRRFIKDIVDEENDIESAIQAVSDRMEYRDNEDQANVGEHWSTYAFEDFNLGNVPQAFLDAYGDEDKAWTALVEYANGGAPAPEVLANLTSQRRWITDFDEARVLRVIAFKPIWDKILDNWWDTGDEELTKRAEAIEAAGYDIVTLDTIANFMDAVQTTKVIWERSKKAESGEFHGTSSDFVRKALPKITIQVEPPFPVTDPDEGED